MNCPTCNADLPEKAKWCYHCEEYLSDMGSTTDVTPEARERIKDTRSEDERKADALEPVKILGWTVLDFEQGFRRLECQKCSAPIAGGTRVPIGIGDWYVMRDGLSAWIEWKTDTNKQTAGQLAFEADCLAAGIPYAVVRSTIEVMDFLEALALEAAGSPDLGAA